MAILNQESSLMEIVKLIGSDVLPDDQKLTLEIAREIRLGFLQQNAFHQEDTCVPMEKNFIPSMTKSWRKTADNREEKFIWQLNI